MSKPSASAVAPPATETPPDLSPGDLLLRAFNDLRDELVSTLWFLLGSRDDAQDLAQEVFLRCWRTRETLPEIQNLRAWIFRVGLIDAKHLHRCAWPRRVCTLLGQVILPEVDACTPTH